MDPEAEEHYIELLNQWKKDEDNVKDKLDEIGIGLTKVMKKLGEITIEDKSLKSKVEGSQQSVMCKEKYHENEPVEYYCQVCNVCICLRCAQTSHDQHRKIDIQQACEERKTQMAELLDRVKTKVVDVEEKMKEQTDLMEKSEEEIYFAYEKVTGVVEERIRNLSKHKDAMKAKLAKILETERAEHATKMDRFKTLVTDLRDSVEFGDDSMKRSTGHEIFLEDCQIVLKRCEELLGAQEMEVYKPRHVEYQVNDHSAMLAPGDVLTVQIDSSQSTAEGECLKEGKLVTESSCAQNLEGKRLQGDKGFVDIKAYPPADGSIKDEESLNGNRRQTRLSPHRYKLIRSFEPHRQGQGNFCPWSISVSETTGHIAIADYYHHRVTLLDSEWNFLGTIGDRGAGDQRIDHPTSVAFTASGDVIVIHGDLGRSNKLSIFTERGYLITHVSEHIINPCTVSVATNGKQLIVSDKGDKTIKVLSPDGTHLIQSIGVPDSDEIPWFAIHYQDIFIASFPLANCVRVFSKDGELLYEIGCRGFGDGQLKHPTGLAIDRFGNLVVCDKCNRKLQIFSLGGEFLNSVKKGMISPHSVAVTKNGDLVVCDTNVNAKKCIHVFH